MAIRDDSGKKMISCRDAAAEYGCSMRYIRKLAEQGKIDSEMLAGSYVVDAAQVKKLASRKASGRERKRSEGFRAG